MRAGRNIVDGKKIHTSVIRAYRQYKKAYEPAATVHSFKWSEFWDCGLNPESSLEKWVEFDPYDVLPDLLSRWRSDPSQREMISATVTSRESLASWCTAYRNSSSNRKKLSQGSVGFMAALRPEHRKFRFDREFRDYP
jgi:hypothetical protein